MPVSKTDRRKAEAPDRDWIVRAPVDAFGVYAVTAATEEEAKELLANWNGSGPAVEFSHYDEEYVSTMTGEMTAELNE